MKIIPLTRGYVTVVDDDDYAFVSQFKWYAAVREGGKNIYAARTAANGSYVYLHRALISPNAGLAVDHKNGDGLDNRRSNLRQATKHQNAMNRTRTTASSGVSGVGYDRSRRSVKRWRAFIQLNRKRHYLGWFVTKEEAVQARRTAANTLYGDFAGSA